MKDIHSHKINHGFQAPKDYFQEIEEKVFDQIQLENVVSKAQSFTIPETYFDTFEAQVMGKISASIPKTKIISIVRNPIFKLTASIASLFTILLTVFSIQQQQDMFSLDALDADYISQIIESDYFYFSEADLEQYISIEDINLSTADISDEELAEYLTNTFDNNDILIGE